MKTAFAAFVAFKIGTSRLCSLLARSVESCPEKGILCWAMASRALGQPSVPLGVASCRFYVGSRVTVS